MSDTQVELGDWAMNVAESLVGDIPHVAAEGWKATVTEAVADMLRQQLEAPASRSRLNTFVERAVRELPGYLPEHVTARLRAKLLGAMTTAGALGKHMQTREGAVAGGSTSSSS